MYHIKPDKRSQRSAKLICKGFNQCIKHQPFNKLTISKIIQISTVGRATFYRLFDSKIDILSYQCDQIFKQATLKSSTASSTKAFFLNCARLFLENHLLFETIISSHHEQIIYNTLSKRLNSVKKRFKIAKNVSDEQLNYFISDLTHLIIATLSTWIQHGEKESARELINMAANTVGIIYRSIR